jgi:hypothetical protein
MGWSRKQLAEKAIYYDEDISSSDVSFPPHVEALRRSMLDFSSPLLGCQDTGDAQGGFQLDFSTVHSQSMEIDPCLATADRIQNEAKSISQGGYPEIVWGDFFKTQFFRPLASTILGSKGDSRRYVK